MSPGHITSADDEPRLFDVLGWSDAREKVVRLGLTRSPRTTLRLMGGEVCELGLDDRPDTRGRFPVRYLDVAPELDPDPSYTYFIDRDGDLARLPTTLANAVLHEASWRGRSALLEPSQPPKVKLADGAHKVLSLHGPWAWAVLHAGQDVENRTWGTAYRGPLLLHASARPIRGERLEQCRAYIARCSGLPLDQVPTEFPSGEIVGMVELVDCSVELRSPWAARSGALSWQLASPRALRPPIAGVRGEPNLWTWRWPTVP
ncbi:MAG: ASCH domain-containing protein [Polyangia bacterium]